MPRSCGVFGFPCFAKYVGRRDGCHSDFGSDPHRDHVAGNTLAHADARVEALTDDVAQSVVDDQIDMDVGVFGQEIGKRWPQDSLGGMIHGSEADRPCWLVPKFRKRCKPGLYLLHMRTDGRYQLLSRLSRRDAAGGARKQPNTQTFFEGPHGLAQRRGRHAQLCRRASEAALARDGKEGGQVSYRRAGDFEVSLTDTCGL